MGRLGIHLALNEEQAAAFLHAADDEALSELLEELEEDEESDQPGVPTDKAWDAIHRCLSDGTLGYGAGPYPLNLAVLGGRQLYKGDNWIMAYVSPEEVRDVAAALSGIDQRDLWERYDRMDWDDYACPVDAAGKPRVEEDFQYTWSNFCAMRDFYAEAARQGLSVLFTADQ